MFGIHFTWKHDFEGIYSAAKKVQEIMKKYDYRVHYGKFFHADPAIWKTFGDDLENLKAKIDSTGSHRFLNCWSGRHIFGD